MKLFQYLIILILASACTPKVSEEAYLFSYFTGRSHDGLHLAYSYDGLKWEALKDGKSFLEPNVGKDTLMRDPCIILGPDGNYHMVWTTSWTDKAIGYASSKDLIHWSEQKAIPVMSDEDSAKNSWAPEIIYDKEVEKYHIFWASTIPGRHSPIQETQKEKGYNHRIYASSTVDFETFEPTRMFYNPDFSVIDATIMPYGNEFVMFVKNENILPVEKNIRIVRSKHAGGPFLSEVSAPITGDYWAEGPTPLQIGDYTYVYFDKYREHHYGVIRSRDLETWEDVTDQAIFPRGIRHGTAFKAPLQLIEKLKLLK